MPWLIILGVVGLALAPVMWLRPNPRQQRVTGLRSLARESGVSVSVETSPLHDRHQLLSAYRWRYPLQRPGPDFMLVQEAVASSVLKSYRPGWRWRVEPLRPMAEAARHRLDALLASLPEDAVVVESSTTSLTLWWDESLSHQAFATLDAHMAGMRDALAGQPDYPSRRAQTPSSPPSLI